MAYRLGTVLEPRQNKSIRRTEVIHEAGAIALAVVILAAIFFAVVMGITKLCR